MKQLDSDESTILFSLSDFKRICKRWKRTIIKGSLLCAAFGVIVSLLLPVKYTSEATFYEKAKTNSNSASKSTALLLLGEERENSAIVMLKSHKILEAAVKKLDLQATIEPYTILPTPIVKVLKHLHYAKENILAQGAHLVRSKYPVIAEKLPEIVAKSVVYSGEIPLYYDLKFTSPTRFEVYDSIAGMIGEGSLATPFVYKNVQFTLQATPRIALNERRYQLKLKPVRRMAEEISDDLKVVSDYKDKSFITLTLHFRSRQETSALLNAVMEAYREHLLEEHHLIVASQVAYLTQRRHSMEEQLATLMHEHAEQLSAHAGSLDLLVATQQNLQKKLLSIDLEIKHIQQTLNEGPYLQAQYSSENDPPFIHQTLAEIRRYRQQCDAIDVVVGNSLNRAEETAHAPLEDEWEKLASIQQKTAEAKLLLAKLESNESLPATPLLLNQPKYRLKMWIQKLADLAATGTPNEKDELLAFRQKFSSYVAHLVHLFEVHEKTLQDRLIHQQRPAQEFQGIDLDTANALYLSYCRELNETEANANQHQYIIDKIPQPDFELSSLIAILTDPVSHEIVKKAGTLALTIKDQTNRTQKELERLNQELDLQRNFLIVHLQQIMELFKLRVDLLRSKIQSIQSITFELLQQKISLLEKSLHDYAASHLNSLQHEQTLILQQKEALQNDFDKLPEQWATEKLLDLYLKTDATIMQTIGSLIESKNISDHLEMSLSAPFDRAVPPLQPRSPHVLIWALLGALLGGLSVTFFALVRSVKNGVEATEDNLRLAGQQVAGSLSLVTKKAIRVETLRRLAAQLCPCRANLSMSGETLLLLENRGPDYAAEFAELLSKRNLKVVVISITFDQIESEHESGLMSYLEGVSKEINIMRGQAFDRIAAGGITDFGSELLESVAFQRLLAELRERYDLIMAVSQAPLLSAEAEALLPIFDGAVLTVTNEKLHELKGFFSLDKKHSFIISL